MLSVHLLTVGSLKERYFKEACAEYQKRLGAYCKLEITELPEARLPKNPSPAQIQQALLVEKKQFEAKIKPGSFVVALCIEGKMISSEQLAEQLSKITLQGMSDGTFLIGSSYGLEESLKRQAQLRLSMSPMTFPHQLARVMCLEQVYRAFQIQNNGQYHK